MAFTAIWGVFAIGNGIGRASIKCYTTDRLWIFFLIIFGANCAFIAPAFDPKCIDIYTQMVLIFIMAIAYGMSNSNCFSLVVENKELDEQGAVIASVVVTLTYSGTQFASLMLSWVLIQTLMAVKTDDATSTEFWMWS